MNVRTSLTLTKRDAIRLMQTNIYIYTYLFIEM